MNNRLYIPVFMVLCALSHPIQAITPKEATVAAIFTTLGITGLSYALVKQVSVRSDKKNDKHLRKFFWTGLLAAPLSYCASLLWFGLTPEWRYIFGSKTAKNNHDKSYAEKYYEDAQVMVQELNSNYRNRLWLLELHKDLIRDLERTNQALQGWHTASLEDSVESFPLIAKETFEMLKKQKNNLEHNLSLLRTHQPFLDQQNAWMCRKTKFEIMHL